jgi:hypothetical protein
MFLRRLFRFGRSSRPAAPPRPLRYPDPGKPRWTKEPRPLEASPLKPGTGDRRIWTASPGGPAG